MEITGQKDNKTERIPDNYVMMTKTTGGRNKYQNSEWKKRKCSVESVSEREITSDRSIARKKKRNIDTSCIFTQMCDEADLTPPVFTHKRYRERDRKRSMFFPVVTSVRKPCWAEDNTQASLSITITSVLKLRVRMSLVHKPIQKHSRESKLLSYPVGWYRRILTRFNRRGESRWNH